MHFALPPIDIVFIVISSVTFALYSVLIKKVPGKDLLVYLFWINAFTYVGFFLVYLVRKFFFEHDVYAIEKLIHEFTLINAPLYILLALCTLGSFLILNKLINEYDVSQVLAFSQISLLFTTIGYLLLGDPIYWPALVSVAIICFGSLIFMAKEISFPNIFAPLKDIPKGMWIGTLSYSLLITLSALITFLLTQKTEIDKSVVESLKHIYPFSFHNPFYFNIGARFFIMVTYFIFIYHMPRFKGRIFTILKDNFIQILSISLVFLVSVYTYQDAYYLTEDKNVLGALSKLNIPAVLLLSTFMLDEEITAPKLFGSLIILAGGLFLLII